VGTCQASSAMSACRMKKSSGFSGHRTRVHGTSMTASIIKKDTCTPRGPISRAMDSAGIRWAAFVGAKPAKSALPRKADVLPVTSNAPPLAASISGVARRASRSSAMTFTWKFRSRISGSMWRKLPKAPPTAL
jgi:hypothetical protein